MLKPIPSADQRGRDHHSQCRLEVFGEHHRRINPSEAGGYGLKAVIASAAKQSSVANTRAGLLRRFHLRSLSYGGQVAPRNDEKRLGRPKWPNSETTASRGGAGRVGAAGFYPAWPPFTWRRWS